VKYVDPFLEHRRAQEAIHLGNADVGLMSSLITVEFNVTELCNRVCVFCPRVDPATYPNRNLNMDVKVVEKAARDLAAIGSSARISFSGFGEALLHRKFLDIVRAVRAILPRNFIEMNTNGDRLTPEKIRALMDAGMSALYVNLYDGPEQREKFDALFAAAGVTSYQLRDHWIDSFGLTLNNRSGMVDQPEIGVGPLKEPLTKPCYYPFYKMLIDWNGDVLFCSNDWGREIIVGNVMRQSIVEIWLGDALFDIREKLAVGDRRHAPCSGCSVDGTLHGASSFERLKDAKRTMVRRPQSVEPVTEKVAVAPRVAEGGRG
jgi:radical SAM protein with 4Fe4S-binding SPASM domain